MNESCMCMILYDRNVTWKLVLSYCWCFQNLFAQQSGEQSEKMFAASQAAMAPSHEPSEKAHTLEEYSYDHFRYAPILHAIYLYALG